MLQALNIETTSVENYDKLQKQLKTQILSTAITIKL